MNTSYDYNIHSVITALREAGVKKGDVVFSHVGTGFLGRPQGESSTFTAAASIIDHAFAEVLGEEGTLIVPTYTYSFCNSEDYDPQTTPSTVGHFTEWFRTRPDVLRSREPIFSVAARGARAHKLLDALPPDSFGEDSIYGRLLRAGGSLCNIGLGFQYATFVHFVEQSVGVLYRHKKNFHGNIIEKGRKTSLDVAYYVRNEEAGGDSLPDLSRLEDDARRAKALVEVPLGRGLVTAVSCRDFFTLAEAGIRKHPWYLTRGFAAHPASRISRMKITAIDIQNLTEL
ncbi:hypothetical protein A3J11_00800 [Candidatus Kaiserbacteria bacterium RIFCSPLOWO2_02_FULL_55_12]|uniref:Aminoglycoside N(3)-acetyltransferase n=1 Tax=Candidatus Kaiserbacteria bacterium RIFCSPLOWO2_02_FULL_55_12 TaxID=1798522 RepID=A0A1F6F2W9_9BACT|nr:MAG: hypothetical protein A3J11_00800 [Candidatus Kaiserbacteria bacterium RIFCSPLOWO2_02_FULL_55_12]